MKMIQCKNCGKIYYSNLTMCPECHNKTPMQKEKILQIVIPCIIGIFIIAFGVYSANQPESTNSDNNTSKTGEIINSSENASSAIEYITVSANDLWNEYEDNEIAADKKYLDQNVEVTGVISDINSKDILTSANVLLRVDGEILGCVQCNFNTEDAKKLADVKKGQKVTIVGTCSGLTLSNVMIDGCELK